VNITSLCFRIESVNAFDRFLQALAFLTILPVKARGSLSADHGLMTYARDLPLAGAVIGLLSGAVYFISSLIWNSLSAALLAVIASIIVTGALHEDGLADTADGFGGGWTREQRLSIMKDSSLGTYGVLALGLGIALRVSTLAMLAPGMGLWALLAVHASARCASVLALVTQDYAGNPTTAKTLYPAARLMWPEAHFALFWAGLAVLPILFLRPGAGAAGLVLGGAMALALALYSKRAIGGYCGDVLGAVEQLFEIGFLLGLAI
jgi:adenosylcobinamide-GDP ribazoletransferase